MNVWGRFAAVVLVVLAGCRGEAPVVDAPRQFPGVAEQDVSFHSAALERAVTYRVYRPTNNGGTGPLPVV